MLNWTIWDFHWCSQWSLKHVMNQLCNRLVGRRCNLFFFRNCWEERGLVWRTSTIFTSASSCIWLLGSSSKIWTGGDWPLGVLTFGGELEKSFKMSAVKDSGTSGRTTDCWTAGLAVKITPHDAHSHRQTKRIHLQLTDDFCIIPSCLAHRIEIVPFLMQQDPKSGLSQHHC